MGAEGTLSSDDKSKVKRATGGSGNKIITATMARIYECRMGNDAWNYSGYQGALVLCVDKNKQGSSFFRMVDLDVSLDS